MLFLYSPYVPCFMLCSVFYFVFYFECWYA